MTEEKSEGRGQAKSSRKEGTQEAREREEKTSSYCREEGRESRGRVSREHLVPRENMGTHEY